jgi:hypothetical protein
VLGRLFGRPSAPDDPLLATLSELPVPIGEAGPFVDGYSMNKAQSGLTRAGANTSGVIAQYVVQWSRPQEKVVAQLHAGDATPWIQWVRQLVVLLGTEDAARQWFDAKSSGFKAYSGHDVGGFKYGDVRTVETPDISEQAELMIAPNSGGTMPLVDTYVNTRRGRLFGSVSASCVGGLEPRTELKDLARELDSRMRAALTR